MMNSEEHNPYEQDKGERDEMELIAEINELASQFDTSDPKHDWKQKKIRGIRDMIKAKFSSLHLFYDFEIIELKDQIRNRNQHIHQLELALQEVLEKFREQLEAQGISLCYLCSHLSEGTELAPLKSPEMSSGVQERIRYLNSLCPKTDLYASLPSTSLHSSL
jgi:beta-N-acetylglucosaminidase